MIYALAISPDNREKRESRFRGETGILRL